MNKSPFEIAAVLLTGIFKILFVDILQAKFWFIIIAGLFWCSFIIIRRSHNRKIFNDWGFRKGGFWPSMRIIIVPAIAVTLLTLIIGLIKGYLIWTWHIIPVMIVYPIWGTLQQFLIISLFGVNLEKMDSPKIPQITIVILTATLFAIVHYPSFRLIIATFILALFYQIIFLKHRNLWALGLFHGWLACFFYYFALGRDPWLEFIGTM